MYQALYRKYRPLRFEDVVGQEHITTTLRRQVETGRTSHAYLFVGSRGTGKTTCAKILSRAINCENPVGGEPCNDCPACRGILSGSILDVVEIDAASNNGVDNVRAIRDEAIYSPASVRKRVYIIDEVHMLSVPAFNALLKILEEPPEHLVFILATTELQKIPATILSRCQRFSFRRLGARDIEGRIKYVAKAEGLTITDGAAALLARLGEGAMRDSLSLLDQCLGRGEITEELVLTSVGLTGASTAAGLWRAVKQGDAASALEVFEGAYLSGTEPTPILSSLLTVLRDMLILSVAPKGSESLLSGSLSSSELRALSTGADRATMTRAAKTLQEAVSDLSTARDQRTAAELALISLAGLFSGEEAEPAEKPARPAPAAISKPAPAPKAAPEPAPEPKPEHKPEPVPEFKPEPKPELKPEPKPISQEKTEAPAPAPSGDWWQRVLASEEIRGLISYMFLSDSANFRVSLDGDRVTLRSTNPMATLLADTTDTKAAIAEVASRILGRRVSVRITEAADEPPAAEDKLDSLLKFGNVTIK